MNCIGCGEVIIKLSDKDRRIRYYRIGTIDTGKSVERLVVVPALYAGLAVTVYLTYGTWGPAFLNTITPAR